MMKKSNSYLGFFMFFVFFWIFFLFNQMSICDAFAADNVVYVDADLTDTYPASATPDCNTYNPSTGQCGGGTADAYSSLRDVNAFLGTVGNYETTSILFRRGKQWTLTSDSDCITVNKSNVTIDAFGSGAKPILDGKDKYPSQLSSANIPIGSAIKVGGGTAGAFTNVHINNLNFRNMYPGNGITFSGDNPGGNFRGPGSVRNCDFYNIGWTAAQIYQVPNTSGSAGAIKFEYNNIDGAALFPATQDYVDHPQALTSNGRYNSDHEARYNVIRRVKGEGIGATGMRVVEYNTISGCMAPSIYFDAWSNSNANCVIRYNVIWRDASLNEPYDGLIKIADEVSSGDNTQTTVEVYGNIVAGGFAGIMIANSPIGTPDNYSPFGSIKVYDNTFIDNIHNYLTLYNDRFNSVVIKNNVSIIHGDVQNNCSHAVAWSPGSWNNWTWGPNSFYGASLPGSPFYNSSVDKTGTPDLPKSSGWRNLTSMPSYSDLYPSDLLSSAAPWNSLLSSPVSHIAPPTDLKATIVKE